MKMKRWKRILSLVLALVMVAPTVLNLVPEMVREVSAEPVSYPDYHVLNRDRKDGLYIIRSALDTEMVLDIGGGATGATTAQCVLDEGKKQEETMRFVLQVNQENLTTECYGIRSVTSTYWLHGYTEERNPIEANVVGQQTQTDGKANYRLEGSWIFEEMSDGTVRIQSEKTGLYMYASGTAAGSQVKIGALPSGDDTAYRWVLEQTHMTEQFFTTGTYWLETRLIASDGTDPTSTELTTPANVITINAAGSAIISKYVPATEHVIDADTGVRQEDTTRGNYEYQQFVIQKISGGFYSIVNVYTGRYLAVDENHNIIDGGLSSQVPTGAERWIIYPGSYTGNTTVISGGSTANQKESIVSKFRIISAADGKQITAQQTNADKDTLSAGTSTLAAAAMENYRTQDWYLKDIRLDANNVEKGDTQVTNTGVFADTFQVNNTVTLPIKIFDYAADGMLFEYAANDNSSEYHYENVGTGKGNYTLNSDGNYIKVENGTGDYIRYRLGNNIGFSMMSRSNGGLKRSIVDSNGNSTTLSVAWEPNSFTQGWITYTPVNVTNGSGSFGYNKYLCPYISELRLNNSDGISYNKVILEYVLNGKNINNNEEFKSAVLVDAGTMNTANAGVKYSGDADMIKALGYAMYGEQTFGRATMGLLEPGLQTVEVGGKSYTLPRYTQEAVEYIAMVLQRALAIRYQSKDGTLNYNYVDGEPSFADLGSGLDLAALLRGDTQENPDATGILRNDSGTYQDEDGLSYKFIQYGSYTETLANSANLIGTWEDVDEYLHTCMDAAYWMLNSIFLEGSYNQPQTQYNSLLLTQVTDQSGKTGYIFDSTFINSSSSEAGSTAVEYNSQNGTIRNTSAAGKSYTYWGLNSSAATYPFTPVRTEDGDASNPKGTQAQTMTPYFLDGGINKSQTGGSEPEYSNANYNFVLQSNATFIYHKDDALFFDFEGDDDVYLFINGQLVLDIGAAHSVTGTKMNLNDYVDWAWGIKNNATAYAALTAAEKERVNALALVEGNAYSFDFYYMERHGWGSNMRIFTNFRLVSGDIEADKAVYQNETELPYGSVVQANDVLEYSFKLTNVVTTTAANTPNLYYLVYNDNDIGVTIDWENGLVVGDNNVVVDKNGGILEVSDLIITLINGDTRTNVSVTTQAALKELLLRGGTNAGLPAGYSLEIRGIYHKLTEQQQSNGLFHNVLSVKASTGDGNNLTSDDMGTTYVATDDTLVRVPFKPMYYQWRGHLLEVEIEKLVSDITTATDSLGEIIYSVPGLTVSSITSISLCDSMGTVATYDNVALNDARSVEINYNATGTQYFNVYIVYTYDGATQSVIVPVTVRVMDVEDKIFVLDYGLHVNLVFDDLFSGDTLKAEDRKTVFEVLGVADEENVPVYVTKDNLTKGNLNSIAFSGIEEADGKWTGTNTATDSYDGSFQIAQDTKANPYLTYTPEEFMEGRDDVYIAVRVSEEGYVTDAIGNTDINNEVEMFKKVTFMPANVVYYEDDFPAVGAPSGSFTIIESVHGKPQSSNQDEQYGHDDVYAGSADVTMSGGTIATVTIERDFVDAATFSFYGTGFEMISRTTAVDSAIVEVSVRQIKDDGSYGSWEYYPVITQFDHSDVSGDKEAVYQVPVFRLEGLTHGQYEVIISGIPTVQTSVENGQVQYEYPTTYLYIDGIRIYNPLGTGSILEYGNENGAKFHELRGLVFDDKAAIIGLATDQNGNPVIDEGKTLIGTYGANHYSFTENLNGWYTTGAAGGLDQFMVAGPNNEVYLDATKGTYAAVLYVKEDVAGQGLLHIGVHDLHDGAFYGTNAANASSAISYWTGENWVTPISIGTSGTEQYYPIDYTACPQVTDDTGTYYCVVIQAQSGMVSFTNVKTVGLEFGTLDSLSANTEYKYENGQLSKRVQDAEGKWGEWEPMVNGTLTANVFSLRRALLSTTYGDLPGEDTPGEDTPGEDTPSENTPSEDTPGEDTPSEDTPGQDDSNEEIPSTDDKSWWEYLLDVLLALLKGFAEVFEGAKG